MTLVRKHLLLSEPSKNLLASRARQWASYAGVPMEWALAVLLDRVQTSTSGGRHGTGH